jgi:hypothetical protein
MVEYVLWRGSYLLTMCCVRPTAARGGHRKQHDGRDRQQCQYESA